MAKSEREGNKTPAKKPLTGLEISRRIIDGLKNLGFSAPHKERNLDQKTRETIKTCPDPASFTEEAKSQMSSDPRDANKNFRLGLNDILTQQEPNGEISLMEGLETSWLETETRRASLPPQIHWDREKVVRRLTEAGILSERKKPIAKKSILGADDYHIILYYNSLAHGFLSYYRCVDNLNSVKGLVNYFLRYSLLATLSGKHKLTSTKAALKKFGKEISSTKGNPQARPITYVDRV